MLRMENVSKTYRHRGQMVTALDGATIANPRRRFCFHRRSQRQRQEHAAVDARRDALALRRPRAPGRPVGLRSEPKRPGTAAEAEGRIRIPDIQSGAVPVGLGERPGSAVPGQGGEKAQKDRATDLLERVGLADRLDHKPCELSVGQQQRVALARMLANDPAVILADEPTGNLDPRQASSDPFPGGGQCEGRTIVMVTHDPRAAERAKRILRLDRGAIVSEKPGREARHDAA